MTLTLSPESFFNYLPKLIATGATFIAEELISGQILIKFTGGY